MSKKMNHFTMFGLKEYSPINITYDLDTNQVIETIGCDIDKSRIVVSEDKCFSIPSFMLVAGIPIFPTKYEFINDGTVVYSSFTPPEHNIKINDKNPLNERAKTKQNTISFKDLEQYDIYGRKRMPTQNQVMGESAKDHVQRLIDDGLLILDDDTRDKIQWHWCHLIAHSMLPTEKAQKKNNLFCGTSACNGHMMNIESAVKRFIYEYKRPLSLEVTVATYSDTQLGRRLRYRIYDKKKGSLHSEYFDVLTDTKTNTLDHFSIYNRLVNAFCDNSK